MMSFENSALVPTLIMKRIPDQIRPARFLWAPLLGSPFQNWLRIHYDALASHTSCIIIKETVGDFNPPVIFVFPLYPGVLLMSF